MEGFRVETACDGEEGLEKIRALVPPVVLLDAMMPRRDGFDVCRTVKADPRLAGVKVVMLTALGQKTDQEKGVAAGAGLLPHQAVRRGRAPRSSPPPHRVGTRAVRRFPRWQVRTFPAGSLKSKVRGQRSNGKQGPGLTCGVARRVFL